MMKNMKLALVSILASTAFASAQEARFFRISGPMETRITRITADGYITWENSPVAGVDVAIQSSCPDLYRLYLFHPDCWHDHARVHVTKTVTSHRAFDLHPPPGQVFIPAGLFNMGDTLGDWPAASGPDPGVPVHSVYVSSFYMDRHEVTKGLWDAVYQWAMNHGYSFEHGAEGSFDDQSAHSMTWYDAVKWCNARSEKEGQVPAYYTDSELSVVYRTETSDLSADMVKWNAGYRLPTEAEWEKAARGGRSGRRFPWGETISWSEANYNALQLSVDPINGYAYDVNPVSGYNPAAGGFPCTIAVGSSVPNGYGLYDMAGNVDELCWDWFGLYSSGLQTDPRGPEPGPNQDRVIRGGNWLATALYCRTAARSSVSTTRREWFFGFRSVLGAKQ
jgi:formylglycine-generating enzyme required for sulfatase activity